MIIRARAPLRLGFAGGGTDLSPFCDIYGGYVLNAAIDLYAYTYIEPSADGRVEFWSRDTGQAFSACAAPEFETNGSDLALHCAVYNRVIKQFCGSRPLSMRMITYCDAPSGSGLGSSSTLVVAMLKAFTEWLNLPLGEYDMARLAFEIERRDLCLSGGRQDQYAATFGGFNFMEFYADERVIVNPLRVKDWIIAEVEASLVLFYTGVSRESARIIDEQTRNVEEKKPGSVDATLALKEDALMMKEAMLKGDLKQFAYFMGKSWEAKKRTAESVSNSKIDQVFEVAMEAGALAGKVSGAGGGGFIMFIVDPPCRPDVISALSRCDEGRVLPCHFSKNGTEGWRIRIE